MTDDPKVVRLRTMFADQEFERARAEAAEWKRRADIFDQQAGTLRSLKAQLRETLQAAMAYINDERGKRDITWLRDEARKCGVFPYEERMRRKYAQLHANDVLFGGVGDEQDKKPE
jgi:hypothetical protein